MARKAQNEELSETQQGIMRATPEGDTEIADTNAAGTEQPAIQPTRQAGPSDAGAGVRLPAAVISEVDRSLISTQSPSLSRQQLKDLRSKLKAKFH